MAREKKKQRNKELENKTNFVMNIGYYIKFK